MIMSGQEYLETMMIREMRRYDEEKLCAVMMTDAIMKILYEEGLKGGAEHVLEAEYRYSESESMARMRRVHNQVRRGKMSYGQDENG